MMSRNKLNAKFAEFGNLQYWDWQKSIGIEPVNLGHNLQYWLKQSPYYQSLSEDAKAKCWNTDLTGKSMYGTERAKETQLNFWNEDVVIAISPSVNNFLDTYDINYVGVGVEDNNSCIQVPESESAFEYAPGQFVSPQDPKYLSTVFFCFINKVAESVKENHSDAILTTYACKFTETPSYGEVDNNIVIVIAPLNEDMELPLTDLESKYNQPAIDNIKAWVDPLKKPLKKAYQAFMN